jgi:hypothetical protein
MIKLATALFVGALFIAGSAFAQDFDPPEQDGSKVTPIHRFARTISRPDGLDGRFDPRTHENCIALLMATEKRMGRELTEEEVKRLLPTIVAALENTAPQTSLERARSRLHSGVDIFTKVLTVDGPRSLAWIKRGTEVISYDVNTGALVANKFVRNHTTTSRSQLSVRPSIKQFAAFLVVNSEQQFFRPSVSAFSTLHSMTKESEILYLGAKRGWRKPVPTPVPIGGAIPTKLEETFFQLELESEPHNFFAKGILLQSYVPSAGGE